MASAMAVNQPTDALLRGVSEGTAIATAAELARVTLVEETEHLQACECCGLSEECTRAYIARVRGVFCGRFVCGLCSEAVKEERARLGSASMEEALRVHMNVCAKFNSFSREDPLVHLAAVAQVMRDILRRSAEGGASSPKRTPRTPRQPCRPSYAGSGYPSSI